VSGVGAAGYGAPTGHRPPLLVTARGAGIAYLCEPLRLGCLQIGRLRGRHGREKKARAARRRVAVLVVRTRRRGRQQADEEDAEEEEAAAGGTGAAGGATDWERREQGVRLGFFFFF